MPKRCKLCYGLVLLAWLPLAGCSNAAHDASPSDARRAEHDPGSKEASRAGQPQVQPTVVLRTSLGEITLRLFPDRAPRTVNNFLNYVENGHYNQTIFHQVEAGYVALGGAFRADLTEKPGRYPIPNEAAGGLKNRRGTIAMARELDAINSSTCQFFINLADNPHLDHRGNSPEEYGFCVFGEVIDGMDVLDKLDHVEVQPANQFEKLPVETVAIESARRLR